MRLIMLITIKLYFLLKYIVYDTVRLVFAGQNPITMFKARRLIEKTLPREVLRGDIMSDEQLEIAGQICASYYRIIKLKPDINLSNTLNSIHLLAGGNLERQYLAVKTLENTIKKTNEKEVK